MRNYTRKKGKTRLDLLVVSRGLAESRERARALIMAGNILVDGQAVAKPAALVPETAVVEVREALPYVGRGGLKLVGALDDFGLDVSGLSVIDVGASTGGFTDVLLKRGAKHVYAVDVGYGQLDWRLRQDRRVTVLERTNIRYLESLPELVDAAVVDVSFISLTLVLPAIVNLSRANAWIIALVKPQFEAGRQQVGRGGVVRDPAVHRAVLEKVANWAREQGLAVRGVTVSPLVGPAGNREFFIHLSKEGESIDVEAAIDRCLRSISGEEAGG